MGRFSVHAGRLVRRHDRRLDNEERSAISSTRNVPTTGGRLGSNGSRAVRGAGVRHQFHWRPLLLGHYYGGSGEANYQLAN